MSERRAEVQTARILAALRAGAQTSKAVAEALAARREAIAVALCRLADDGLVERAGVIGSGGLGRPYVRWRVRRTGAASAAQSF